MVEGTPKIPKIQNFKRVKSDATNVVDQAITKVETIYEDKEDVKMTRATSNATIVKSLDIFLAKVIPTRMIHKKLKQSLQGKKMMRDHTFNGDY